MKKYQLILPLIGLLFERQLFMNFFPLKLKLDHVVVIDGDTLFINKNERLRLIGIDAPELKQPIVGSYSAKCLKAIINNKKKWMAFFKGKDIYDRWLGDVCHEDNCVSVELLKLGCVVTYPSPELSKAQRGENLRLVMQAKRRHLGLWQFKGFMNPQVYRRLVKKNQKARRNPTEAL